MCPNHHIWCSSVSIPLDNHHISCDGGGVITAASFDARKPLPRKSSRIARCVANVQVSASRSRRGTDRFGFDTQPLPDRCGCRTDRGEDDHVAVRAGSFGVTSPPRLHLGQHAVESTTVIFPVIERRAPPGALEQGPIVRLGGRVASALT